MINTQQVGPKVRVRIEYQCNGCQFHSIAKDDTTESRYHACNHPATIERYTCPQFMGGTSKDLTIYHTCDAPKWLCPYIIDNKESQ